MVLYMLYTATPIKKSIIMQKNRSRDSRLNVDSLLREGRGRGFGVISGAYYIDTDLQVALYTGTGRREGRKERGKRVRGKVRWR